MRPPSLRRCHFCYVSVLKIRGTVVPVDRLMEIFWEPCDRLAITVRMALVAALLLFAIPSWAGPLLTVTIGPGGKLHNGPQKDPDLKWGNAKNLGALIAGNNVFQIQKGAIWFNSQISLPGHHMFFGPGQQIFVYGSIDPDDDGGPHDRNDVWGVLMAAKFLNYRFLHRNGKTLFIAEVLETINPKLAALLGLHETTYHATLELQLMQIETGKQTYGLVEGGVLTTGAIPEPPSIVLLGVPPLWFAAKRYVQRSRFRRLS